MSLAMQHNRKEKFPSKATVDYATLRKEFEKLVQALIQENFSSEIVNWCNEFGYFLTQKTENHAADKNIHKNPLTSSQLRRFFGMVKRLQLISEDPTETISQILRLKLMLVYAVGKDLITPSSKNDRQESKGAVGPSSPAVHPSLPSTQSKIAHFYDVLSLAIDKLIAYLNELTKGPMKDGQAPTAERDDPLKKETTQKFQKAVTRFVNFVEAIVAYHKLHGGK